MQLLHRNTPKMHWPAQKLPITIIILTFNEELNIADCLSSCAWSDDVHVLDSGSTDRTCEIAQELGASVHHHPFSSFGEQRNWAIEHIPHRNDWVFHLDADERFTAELVDEMRRLLASKPMESGFYVPHKMMVMGRWLKHSEGYPIYQMRLFHKGRMRFRDYGHGQREDTSGLLGTLREPYLHFTFNKGVEDWVEKHNRYSTLEARQIFLARGSGTIYGSTWLTSAVQRRRFFKERIYPKLPGKWIGRFIWMYFIKLGFLDGLPGLHYCLLVSAYELFTSLKLRELQLQAKVEKALAAAQLPANRIAETPVVPPESGNGRHVMRQEDIAVKEPSPWTLKENIVRAIWMVVRRILFRTSFHNWYGWRRLLLRCFGARIGRDVRIRPTAMIEIPWNLEIGDASQIGDQAIIYSLGRIVIGRHVVVSQYAHLCAGTHDYTSRRFPLLRPPILIEDDAWIAADAFVGPGVTIGARSVVGARATALKNVPPDQVVGGSPARFIKTRVLND